VTEPSFAPIPAQGSGKLVQHAADVLIDSANYTRASSREVAGWCWNDIPTGKLAYLVRANVGDPEGVAMALSTGRKGARYISCSWHTHPWSSHVVPGPSKRDLLISTFPPADDITHYVIDQHGIWRYARGHVTEMCPWNSSGDNFDRARCRS